MGSRSNPTSVVVRNGIDGTCGGVPPIASARKKAHGEPSVAVTAHSGNAAVNAAVAVSAPTTAVDDIAGATTGGAAIAATAAADALAGKNWTGGALAAAATVAAPPRPPARPCLSVASG